MSTTPPLPRPADLIDVADHTNVTAVLEFLADELANQMLGQQPGPLVTAGVVARWHARDIARGFESGVGHAAEMIRELAVPGWPHSLTTSLYLAAAHIDTSGLTTGPYNRWRRTDRWLRGYHEGRGHAARVLRRAADGVRAIEQLEEAAP